MTRRILVLIDVSNIYYCSKNKFNGKVDYEFLLNKIKGDNCLWRTIAYGSNNEKGESFRNRLEDLGIELKFQDSQKFADGKEKANVDVRMAVDAIRIAPEVDTVVFVTADGDFAPCLEYISFLGKRVEVWGVDISRKLKSTADRWIELTRTCMFDLEDSNVQQI